MFVRSSFPAGSAVIDQIATEKAAPLTDAVSSERRMDDFTQFQLKEYENISQAHFKTNEVLATFYRYSKIILQLSGL